MERENKIEVYVPVIIWDKEGRALLYDHLAIHVVELLKERMAHLRTDADGTIHLREESVEDAIQKAQNKQEEKDGANRTVGDESKKS